MMQPIFRVILIIVSLATMAFIMRKIRQAKVQIEAAIFWVIVALILVVFSLCPAVADACSRLLGIYSTPNFLFLFMIFLLLIKVFGMTLQLSQLESRQKELVQKMALQQKEKEELLKKLERAEEQDTAGDGWKGEKGPEQASAAERAGEVSHKREKEENAEL